MTRRVKNNLVKVLLTLIVINVIRKNLAIAIIRNKTMRKLLMKKFFEEGVGDGKVKMD